eukprot:SAG31_NODE_2908_length_4922_cov_5.967655_4_plen_101_part_00
MADSIGTAAPDSTVNFGEDVPRNSIDAAGSPSTPDSNLDEAEVEAALMAEAETLGKRTMACNGQGYLLACVFIMMAFMLVIGLLTGLKFDSEGYGGDGYG